jgi:hypothetical protein
MEDLQRRTRSTGRRFGLALLMILLAGSLAAPVRAAGPEAEPASRYPCGRPGSTFNSSPPHLPPILDFLLLRPAGAVATVVGLTVWTVSAPFNLLAGTDTFVSSAETLVGCPGYYTFVAKLGSH